MNVTFEQEFVFIPPGARNASIVYRAGKRYANVKRIAVLQAKARGVKVIEHRSPRAKRSSTQANEDQDTEEKEVGRGKGNGSRPEKTAKATLKNASSGKKAGGNRT